jgi:hypothetical protein
LLLFLLVQLFALVTSPLDLLAQPGLAEMGEARSWIREYFFFNAGLLLCGFRTDCYCWGSSGVP